MMYEHSRTQYMPGTSTWTRVGEYEYEQLCGYMEQRKDGSMGQRKASRTEANGPKGTRVKDGHQDRRRPRTA